MEALWVLGFALAAGGLIYLAWRAEQARREAFRRWAAARGWSYRPGKDRAWAARHAFLERLRQGGNRYAFDLLEGPWNGGRATAFSFHYETSDGKHTCHHHLNVVTVALERPFPELLLAPEGFLERFFQALSDDIDFESVEFSRAFRVRSRNKRFAYDFCHPRMMEYLLAHRDVALEVDGDVLALLDGGKLALRDVEGKLERVDAIRALIPAYLLRDASLAAPSH
ncbi:MAG: hypothetical protein EYC70_07370 [Planctomycetota bacterium]|nr:MAG: hypothetical protein EYC70_07370 [Planctomycetota bacterium]